MDEMRATAPSVTGAAPSHAPIDIRKIGTSNGAYRPDHALSASRRSCNEAAHNEPLTRAGGKPGLRGFTKGGRLLQDVTRLPAERRSGRGCGTVHWPPPCGQCAPRG